MTTFPQRRIRPTPRKDEIKLIKTVQDKSDEIIAQCREKALQKSSNAWRNWIIEMTHLYFHFMTRYVKERASDGVSVEQAMINAQRAAKTFAEFDGMQPHLQLNNMIFQIIEQHVNAWISDEFPNKVDLFVDKYLLTDIKKNTSAWTMHAKCPIMLQDLYDNVPEPRTYAKQLSTALKRKRASVSQQADESSDHDTFNAKRKVQPTMFALLKEIDKQK